MLSTWRLDSEQKEPQLVRYTNAASAINSSSWHCPHIACDICRSRKLKCSGEPNGCKRCRSMRITCTYPSTQETRRRKRNSQPAEGRHPSRPTLGPAKASEPTEISKHATGAVDQMMKDDDMEEYDGQDLLEGWPKSNDLSMPLPEKVVKTSAQDWPDMLSDIDDFTYAWDVPPSSIPTWDELSPSLLKPANVDEKKDPSITSGDQAVQAQPLQVEDFGFGMESPLPGQMGTFIPQSALSNNDNNDNNTTTQSRLDPPLANMRSLPVELNVKKDNNNNNNNNNEDGDDGSCHCLKSAACLLEVLSTQMASVMTTMMDELLSQYKVAARQVSHILQCSKCASRSENMMLLAMIGQHICTICEKMVHGHLYQSGSVDNDLWLGSFKIQAASEKNLLFKSLILLQLKEFSALLEKLKVRAAALKAQMDLLQAAERKVQKLGWLINRSAQSKA